MKFKELVKPSWKKGIIFIILAVVSFLVVGVLSNVFGCAGGHTLNKIMPNFCSNYWMYPVYLIVGLPAVIFNMISLMFPSDSILEKLIISLGMIIQLIIYPYILACWLSLIRFRRKK